MVKYENKGNINFLEMSIAICPRGKVSWEDRIIYGIDNFETEKDRLPINEMEI